MNTIKKIMAMIISLMMVLTMSVPVFATTPEGTITINTGDISASGITFNIYKLMDATVSGTSNVNYTVAESFKKFFSQDSVANSNDDEIVYKYLNTHVKETDFQTNLTAYINVSGNSVSADATITGSTAKSYTSKNLPYGYYVIIPSGTFAPSFLTLHSENAKTYLKGQKPDVTKTVENEKWTSAQVGDTVNFKIESIIPSMIGYHSFTYEFTDKMSDGLTFKNDIKVNVGKTEIESTKYQVDIASEGNTFKLSFKAPITDLSDYANQKLTITYSATLNEKAVKTGKETNEANVKYTNGPDSTTEGTPSTTKVVTHDLIITKVDSNDNKTKLAGATFNLYKGNSVDSSTPIQFTYDSVNNVYTVAMSTDTESGKTSDLVTTDSGVITIKGLDDGDYRLVETKAPDGYAKLKNPVEINIQATSSNDGATITLEGNEIVVENKTESWLPETGGMGTVVFTVVGAVGLLAVLSSFVADKKRKMK